MVGKAAPAEQVRTAALGLRITPNLKEALAALAKAERRTLASYVELVLEAHVEQKRKEGKRR
jgi:predicted DNA-binding protein